MDENEDENESTSLVVETPASRFMRPGFGNSCSFVEFVSKLGQLRTTANQDKSFEKERRVHAAAWQKGSLCRLKPAFLGDGVKLCPSKFLENILIFCCNLSGCNCVCG
jgi:hypothetical protein